MQNYNLESEETDMHPLWDYDRNKINSVHQFLINSISEKYGKQNTYYSSADWGGLDVWTVKGDNHYGIFIVIHDNDSVMLLERSYNALNDENNDVILFEAENISELKELFTMAEKLK